MKQQSECKISNQPIGKLFTVIERNYETEKTYYYNVFGRDYETEKTVYPLDYWCRYYPVPMQESAIKVMTAHTIQILSSYIPSRYLSPPTTLPC